MAGVTGRVPIKATWRALAKRVIADEASFFELSDHDLRKKSLALRYEVLSGKTLEQVQQDAFMLVREAARRTVSMQHYPVQLIGGAAMASGAVCVMQTGEGKTLTATLPLYLAALAGKGAHLATANDYLAARDAELMRPVFEALGMTVGVVEQKTERVDRRAAYRADITYSTAKEIGFDFLRDRLMIRQSEEADLCQPSFADTQQEAENEPVQRELHFLLVDEADSILIDEARTPLVISSIPDDLEERRALYEWSAQVVGDFEVDRHFEFDEEKRSVELTATGRTFLRKLSKPEQLAKVAVTDIYDQLELALLVEQKFVRERDYVVRDGEVVIVDEFTGRMAEGRKWRAGLHQAIEAREELQVTAETAEAARISVQDLCQKYQLLCGMTGTIASSAKELNSIYETPVATIPTNRPPQRKRLPDMVFGNADAKWDAIVAEVTQCHAQGQPVLVGTRSIDKSEELSKRLQAAGVKHTVLNARHLDREAEIVAQAGQVGQVTVATNMAGRGTDIRLADEALELGGLHVIISELHESERIDRQLIGRCGRQGDPGSFRFFMSLDDDILLTGLGAKVANRMKRIGAKRPEQPTAMAREFRQAQSKVESNHFKGRKLLMHQESNRQQAQRELGQDPYVDTIS